MSLSPFARVLAKAYFNLASDPHGFVFPAIMNKWVCPLVSWFGYFWVGFILGSEIWLSGKTPISFTSASTNFTSPQTVIFDSCLYSRIEDDSVASKGCSRQTCEELASSSFSGSCKDYHRDSFDELESSSDIEKLFVRQVRILDFSLVIFRLPTWIACHLERWNHTEHRHWRLYRFSVFGVLSVLD